MNTIKKTDSIRFIVLSITGVLLFFVPVCAGKVPVVYMIDAVKNLTGKNLKYIVVISNLFLAVSLILAEVFRNRFCRAYYRSDSGIKKLFFSASVILTLMTYFNLNLPFIRDPDIGGRILGMASTVFLTIALAGTLVIFIINSGIVESVSILMEPVMQPVFRLPGEAAINIISSFVSSASVGVYFTEKYYENNTYTTRQACTVVTSFSVISVGYVGVLASIAGIGNMYGTLLIGSFVLVLIMGAIMIRIPPLSHIKNTCIDGSASLPVKPEMKAGLRLKKALQAGSEKSRDFTPEEFRRNFLQALMFAQKTVGVMVPTVMFVLALVKYTPLFTWLGYPVAPLIRLLGIPDSSRIAPSVLVGIVEVSLPSILAAGAHVSAKSAFFVVQLSIVQIIFFSEAGNAILSSKIPLSFWDLIKIFAVRTLIAMPLVAILTNMLF